MLASISTNGQSRMPYHEFYKNDFEPREHYRPLWEHIRKTGQSTLGAKAHESHLALRTEGVTFTVYSDNDEGIERRRMFAQALPLAESEQRDCPSLVLQQDTADDGAILILQQIHEPLDLRRLSWVSFLVTHFNSFPQLPGLKFIYAK